MDLNIKIAAASDNAAILDFYNNCPMVGKTIQLRSFRKDDFFKFLKYQSDEPIVYIYKKDDVVEGVATLCVRDAYVNGKPQKIVYLGDLRVKSRRAIMAWRKAYGEVLLSMNLPTITAVIDENTLAQNSLIQTEKTEVQYESLAPYKMVNILFKLPFVKKRTSLRVRRGSAQDFEKINNFLDSQNRKKAFGYNYSLGELKRRLDVWDDFSFASFLIAESNEGEILGCLSLWSPSKAKVNIIEKIPTYYQLLKPFFNFPKTGGALNAIYLCNLEVNIELDIERRQEIFRCLFDEAYSSSRGQNMISFCDYPSSNFKDALRGYIFNTVPMRLYTVRHKTGKALQFSPETLKEIGFEIALV